MIKIESKEKIFRVVIIQPISLIRKIKIIFKYLKIFNKIVK